VSGHFDQCPRLWRPMTGTSPTRPSRGTDQTAASMMLTQSSSTLGTSAHESVSAVRTSGPMGAHTGACPSARCVFRCTEATS
jgi:hypothetical protein